MNACDRWREKERRTWKSECRSVLCTFVKCVYKRRETFRSCRSLFALSAKQSVKVTATQHACDFKQWDISLTICFQFASKFLSSLAISLTHNSSSLFRCSYCPVFRFGSNETGPCNQWLIIYCSPSPCRKKRLENISKTISF